MGLKSNELEIIFASNWNKIRLLKQKADKTVREEYELKYRIVLHNSIPTNPNFSKEQRIAEKILELDRKKMEDKYDGNEIDH